jgi:4-hydroxy-tetrahydrodipicolinate reductase
MVKFASTLIILISAYCSNSIHAFTPNVQIRTSTNTALHMSSFDDVKVMVNGMPGPMATAAAEACLRKGLSLSPVAMTGPDVEPATITVVDDVTGKHGNVRLIPSSNMEEMNAAIEGLRSKIGDEGLLAIDYTHPSAVNSNAKFYAEKKIPFVMGTTGGDRDQLMKDMEDASASAVIAPNMGKQIVAMQAALEDLASKYPSAFGGYTLHTRESHQKTKADTSGTAKAVVDSLKVLSGNDGYTYDDIEMIRDDQESLDFGVKEEYMNGHAFHTYTLTSPDNSVEFQLKHNVSGRNVYAEGTADAIKFLAKKISEGSGGKVYSMINVLEEGAME